ncbi:hypothetical protein CXB51_033788 [Gossypium anomalum]|uniref:Zinc knuckle CX2CX4HX4C domain-containing protein n=1 Tax=Gossypium anomalum TaxID=47600 RepID=A0A8J5Y1I2_9ROSI|nr:hypothetical protein CXB51_033788 [Gossypium anomalum]
MVGNVIKLDDDTGNAQKGRFARMTILLDLNKPLISRTKVDGRIQQVEYESLPNLCFACGCYGHTKDMCSFSSGQERQKGEESVLVMDQGISDTANNGVENEKYGLWMLVDRRGKRNSRKQSDDRQAKKRGGFIGIQI